jgi:hypothetical protein
VVLLLEVVESTRNPAKLNDTPLRPFSLRRAASPDGQSRPVHRVAQTQRVSLAWVIYGGLP